MNSKTLFGKTFNQIIIDELAASISKPIYCRFCGKDINKPSIDSPEKNWNKNLDWELKYHAHVKCYQKHL